MLTFQGIKENKYIWGESCKIHLGYNESEVLVGICIVGNTYLFILTLLLTC
jgi:hypothetical protein